jgi:DNA polymerase III sliding clamp (beta) subunit (PCNA family)
MITPEYIKNFTLDIAKTSVTYVELDAKEFESYYCKEPIIIGIDTATFFKAIKSAIRQLEERQLHFIWMKMIRKSLELN